MAFLWVSKQRGEQSFQVADTVPFYFPELRAHALYGKYKALADIVCLLSAEKAKRNCVIKEKIHLNNILNKKKSSANL